MQSWLGVDSHSFRLTLNTACLITEVCCNINNPTSSQLAVMCYLTSEENASEVAHIRSTESPNSTWSHALWDKKQSSYMRHITFTLSILITYFSLSDESLPWFQTGNFLGKIISLHVLIKFLVQFSRTKTTLFAFPPSSQPGHHIISVSSASMHNACCSVITYCHV